MLVEFTVGNFRSFKDPVTLNMAATRLVARDKHLDENNLVQVSGAPPLLISAAIYGANASGKSNLINAMHFMRSFVLNSPVETRPTGAIDVEAFRLSSETARQPSHFETIFLIEGKRYRYGFELDKERITSEWLYHVPGSREARLFERDTDKVVLTNAFKEGRGMKERTRPNALFLSVVAQFNGPVAQKILRWFRDFKVISGLQDEGLRPYTVESFHSGEHRDEILKLVLKLDLGISNLLVESEPLSLDSLPAGMPEEFRKWLMNMPRGDTEAVSVNVKTMHRKYSGDDQLGEPELFDLDDNESEGTKKLFSLAGPLVDTLKTGKVLAVDELDARLHPLMTCAIIRLFNSKESNPCRAQLIFTTHDTNLLDNKLFRRDQIWFTEKDRRGASHLYSLAEFKIRNDALFERDYIRGRFGAVPFIGDLRRILDEPCEA